MALNLTIESPDFTRIAQESGDATRDAIKRLYDVLNEEQRLRRIGVREAQERAEWKVKTLTPTGALHNLELDGASILLLQGSATYSITGFRAPETGVSRLLIVHQEGTGTITFEHLDGGSSTIHQLRNATGADVTKTQDQTIIYDYLSSRWRQLV